MTNLCFKEQPVIISSLARNMEMKLKTYCGKCTAMRKDLLSQRPPLTVPMCVGVNRELVEPSIDSPLVYAAASSLLTSLDPPVSFSP